MHSCRSHRPEAPLSLADWRLPGQLRSGGGVNASVAIIKESNSAILKVKAIPYATTGQAEFVPGVADNAEPGTLD
ncbi:unnamed protein product [Didymodactylos carnosus]|uniref:Uncharacterized protein n=1 Tax=Didymodactylos carnosus TaxID=1234261 RepID=A0A815WHB5_9BILA|nr:unnamed protein product [Didymodactylos carnosus]CAF4405447.1 unnamed protein product [Didymodactylos carnosus]